MSQEFFDRIMNTVAGAAATVVFIVVVTWGFYVATA